MKFFTPDQCAEWLNHRGVAADDAGPQFSDAAVSTPKFTIPVDAGHRVALARVLWECIAQNSAETLLWTTYWHAWPSGQHLPIATALRKSFGELRTMGDAPGCVTRSGESDDALSLLITAILFLWDSWAINADGSKCLFLSHDEYGMVYCQDKSEVNRIDKQIAAIIDATEPRREPER